MRFTLTLLIVFLYSSSFSCLNEYYSLDSKGRMHPIEMDQIRFNQYFDQKSIENELLRLKTKLKKGADFKLLSDYGLLLVQAGKVSEALIIFEKLAKLHPNEYPVIANLGTTYELSGNNEKALEYIRKGIEINPGSHQGSEWIHIKILEAKIALKKDPAYLAQHSVLNLNSKQKQSQKVFDQLYYQLKERFPFSPKGPNAVMADLLIEMGDFYFDNISFEHAKALYQLAGIYYQSDRKDLDQKIERARKLREKYAHQNLGDKVTGVPYQNYVYNPSGSDYTINWSKIETNPDKLLALAGLEQLKEEPAGSDSLEKRTKNDPPEAKPAKKPNSSILWIGLTIVVLIVAIFTYFKSKRK